MKLFLLVYGLVSMVSSNDGTWVLMLDTSRMRYEDGTPAIRHYAEVELLDSTATTPRIVGMAGDDWIIDGKGTPGERTELDKGHLLFYDQAVRDPRVNPDCVDRGKSCYRDGHNMLAGRILLRGKVTVAPVAVTASWDLNASRNFPDLWAFTTPGSVPTVNNLQGHFGSAVAIMMEVDNAPSLVRSIPGLAAQAPLTLQAKKRTECDALRGLFEPPADNVQKPCVFLFASNHSTPQNEMRHDDPESMRDHSELIFALFADQSQPRLGMTHRERSGDKSAGSPPGGLCTTGFMAGFP